MFRCPSAQVGDWSNHTESCCICASLWEPISIYCFSWDYPYRLDVCCYPCLALYCLIQKAGLLSCWSLGSCGPDCYLCDFLWLKMTLSQVLAEFYQHWRSFYDLSTLTLCSFFLEPPPSAHTISELYLFSQLCLRHHHRYLSWFESRYFSDAATSFLLLLHLLLRYFPEVSATISLCQHILAYLMYFLMKLRKVTHFRS